MCSQHYNVIKDGKKIGKVSSSTKDDTDRHMQKYFGTTIYTTKMVNYAVCHRVDEENYLLEIG